MSNSDEYSYEDFGYGNGKVLPMCFIMDVSGSMGEALTDLKNGFNLFQRDVKNDVCASRAVHSAIILFANEARVIQDFKPVSEWSLPTLTAGGNTNIVAAVEKGLSLVESHYQAVKQQGRPLNKPWLAMLTDGEHNASGKEELYRIADVICQKQDTNQLVFFPIGVGSSVNWEDLKRFNPERIALELKNQSSFSGLFKFFSSSAISGSSNPSDSCGPDLEQLCKAFGVR